MPKLFSYVVDHNYEYAPHPFGDFCSLAKCKYGIRKRNIVELTEVGDWIAGTGGVDLSKSAGHGKLIYAMRVDEAILLNEYCQAHFRNRIDAEPEDDGADRLALISHHFFYFGRNAIDISEIPTKHLDHTFEKSVPGHRSDFSQVFVEDFAKLLKSSFKVGVHGPPCKTNTEPKLPKYPSKVRRMGCTA